MEPVVDELAAVGGLGLGDLVLVVRELQVLAAAVDVDGLAQVAVGHGGALNVPAGPALAPGGVPIGLTGLGGLPEGEVQGILLHVVDVDPSPCLEVLNGLVGEFSVVGKLLRAVVHIPVHRIGIALVDEGLDQVDDLGNVLRGLGVDGGVPHPQAVGVLEVLLDVLLGNGLGCGALLVGPVDDLVVHVGEVLHEGHLVPPVLQVPAQHVEEDHGPGIAHVDVVVDRGAAAVHLHLSRGDGDELLLLAGHGVKQLHVGSPSSVAFLLLGLRRSVRRRPGDAFYPGNSPAKPGGS